MKFKLSLLSSALLAGLSFGASAETTQPQNNELEAIDVITKLVNEKGYKAERTDITGVNTSILDTPYSIDVVTKQQLEDKQPDNLEDAVKGISGLSQGNNLAGTLDTVKRRGYGGNRDGSIMRNGLASPLARNFNANVERVEVLKGPASALYGMQNPGGVINVVTKKPNHESQKTSFELGYGNHHARNFVLDVTGPISDSGFAYRLVAQQKKKHSWRSFGENRETLVAPSLSWQNEQSKVELAYEYQDYKGDFDRGTFLDTNPTLKKNVTNPNYGKPVDVPLERRLDDPINVTRGYSHTLQFNAEHKLNPNWTLKAEYGYSKNHYADWQVRVMKYDASKREVTRRVDSTRPSDAINHSLNLSAIGVFEQSDSIIHQLRTAIELQKYQLTIGDLRRSKNHSMSIDKPDYGSASVYQGQQTAVAEDKSSDMTEQYKTLGLVLQDSIYFGDKWIVAGGVRAQWHKIYSGQGREQNRFRNQDSGFALLPQLGLVYLISPDWSVYGNMGLSAKPNPSRSWNYNGEKIKLEKSRQFEVGSKYNNEWLSANLALFHIVKDDTAKRYKDASGEQVIRIAGKDRSQGIELDINGQLTERLTLSANYTYTKTKVLRDDAEPQNLGTAFDSTPKHTAGLTLVYDWGNFAGGNWRTGAGVEYIGTWGFNYIDSKGNATWFKMPATTLYNAFISYDTKIGQQDLNLRLTGKNLSNKRYFSSHTTATMEHLAIGSPREIFLSAKFSF